MHFNNNDNIWLLNAIKWLPPRVRFGGWCMQAYHYYTLVSDDKEVISD